MRLQQVPSTMGLLWLREALLVLVRHPWPSLALTFPLALLSVALEGTLGILGVGALSLLLPMLIGLLLLGVPMSREGASARASLTAPAGPAASTDALSHSPLGYAWQRLVALSPAQRRALWQIGLVMAPLSMLLRWLLQLEGMDEVFQTVDPTAAVGGAATAASSAAAVGASAAASAGSVAGPGMPGAASPPPQMGLLLLTALATLGLEVWITLASAVVIFFAQPAAKSLFAATLVVLRNLGACLVLILALMPLAMLVMSFALVTMAVAGWLGAALLSLASVVMLAVLLLSLRACVFSCCLADTPAAPAP